MPGGAVPHFSSAAGILTWGAGEKEVSGEPGSRRLLVLARCATWPWLKHRRRLRTSCELQIVSECFCFYGRPLCGLLRPILLLFGSKEPIFFPCKMFISCAGDKATEAALTVRRGALKMSAGKIELFSLESDHRVPD